MAGSIVAPLLLAGCLAGPSGSPTGFTVDVVETDRSPETREEGELWVAWLHGEETRTAIEGSPSHPVCSAAFDHRLDAANRTLTYEDHTYPDLDPRARVGPAPEGAAPAELSRGARCHR